MFGSDGLVESTPYPKQLVAFGPHIFQSWHSMNNNSFVPKDDILGCSIYPFLIYDPVAIYLYMLSKTGAASENLPAALIYYIMA